MGTAQAPAPKNGDGVNAARAKKMGTALNAAGAKKMGTALKRRPQFGWDPDC